MEISEVTPTISIVILSLFCMLLFRKPWRKPALPPGPRGLPIVGYLPFMSEDSIVYTSIDIARQYGPIFKIQIGSQLWVVITSPSIAKELTKDKDTIFGNHINTVVMDIFSRGRVDIPFSPYGSYWRDIRKMVVHVMLSKGSIDTNEDLRKVEVRKAIKQLSSKAGTPVDIGEFLVTTILNVLMKMVWGRTLEADDSSTAGVQFRALFPKYADLINKPNISDIFPMIARFDIQGVKKETRAISQSIEDILERIINKCMNILEAKERKDQARNTKKDFMQYIFEAEKEENGGRFSRTQIKTVIISFFMGGCMPTSLAHQRVMIELLRNKEVMQKVQKELDDVIGVNNIVEEFHLPKLKYLEAVVKETIRLHPMVPMLPRCPSHSCTVAGYSIPKHTCVYINIWAIQRDPELWENPSEFRPERFLNEPGKWDFWGNNLEYFPFGSGRRICAGISLQQRMVMHILASLLHSFDWQPTETKEMDDPSPRIINDPIFAIPTKRLPNPDLYA